MNDVDFKLTLRESLLRLPVVNVSSTNPNQIMTRCPLCGDSIKDYSHTHFSILVDVDNSDMPVLFQCFRCKSSGILTNELMHMLEIHDLELCSTLKRYNKKTVVVQSKKGFKFDFFDYRVPPVAITNRNIEKIKYINDRLGINIKKDDIDKYKIVCSLKDFLEFNKIPNITCHEERAIMIEKDYVGFLTTKNNYIIFRDITGKNKYRYIKYPLRKDILVSSTYYSISSRIDLFSDIPVNIYVAEGTMDILGIYNHIIDDKENSIFIAVSSSNFISPIMDFLKRGISGNVNIHIYADSDNTNSEYYIRKTMLPVIGPWVNNIYLYHNNIAKDCGVRKEEIDLSVRKIK